MLRRLQIPRLVAVGSVARSATASPKQFSELQGPASVPLLDQLVGYYVNVQSRKMYYKDFLRIEHQAVRWAFADIRKNSEALAHGLLQVGLRPGNKVLAIQPCNCETLVMQLACAKIGVLLCIVPHSNITADKLRYYLNEFQPTLLAGREWMIVPEVKQGEVVERNMHFWDTIYNVLPELGLSYPGQKFQWLHSQEFYHLKKVIITDHNMNLLGVSPLRRMLVWGPFSYYEQRLRRLSALLHPDDPILALEDPKPMAEDKPHVVFSHRNCMLNWRSAKGGNLGLVPHAEAKVVGDRGVSDAKVLSVGTRGNLKLKGPHVSPSFYNNAGLLTETVDENGFVSTSREATFDEKGNITVASAQLY